MFKNQDNLLSVVVYRMYILIVVNFLFVKISSEMRSIPSVPSMWKVSCRKSRGNV